MRIVYIIGAGIGNAIGIFCFYHTWLSLGFLSNVAVLLALGSAILCQLIVITSYLQDSK